MKNYLFSLLIVGITTITIAHAQGEAAMSYLTLLTPSSNLTAAGGAYTALPTNDPFGFLYNPAQLGQFSQFSNGGIKFDRRKINQFYPDEHFFDIGFSLGYNLKNINEKLPLSIGMGYMLGYWSLGEGVLTDLTGTELGKFEMQEYYNAFGIGATYEYFVKTSVGITYKRIVSDLGSAVSIDGENEKRGDECNAFDFGIILNLPFLKTFYNYNSKANGFYPFMDINFGYAILNVGEELHYKYLDMYDSDPLPRQARLGNTLKLGLGKRFNDTDLYIVTLEYSSEANDILVERDASGNIEYQGLFGDINVINSLFLWDDQDKVTVRRGLRLGIYEIMYLSMGFIDQPNYEQMKPFGLGVSLKGILKSISMVSNKSRSNNFINHMDLQFAYTNLNMNSDAPMDEKDFWGIQFVVYGY